jgi:hypothetical protein
LDPAGGITVTHGIWKSKHIDIPSPRYVTSLSLRYASKIFLFSYPKRQHHHYGASDCRWVGRWRDENGAEMEDTVESSGNGFEYEQYP